MASIRFSKVYLGEASTISSKNEKINTKYTIDDFYNDERTIEGSEVKLQKTVLKDILNNNKIDSIIGADLSSQLAVSNKVAADLDISYLGVYNACASFPEELIVGGALLQGTTIKNIACVISSHNLAAERTFRYPIEYGTPRRITQSFTATGAVSALLTKKETNIKVESCTIGKVVDYGVKDANNMGAIMAPGAVNTLISHLRDLKRDISYYDLVLTGDLGKLGSELFKELLSKHDITIKHHIDAGSILITDKNLTDQGASGPVCLPLVLFEKILKEKKYKHILIIGTGALHNTLLVNQKSTIPTVSHAVSLEVLK